mgnify:CR=1 FL=1
MPKTRHEKFLKCFDTYMSNLKINELVYILAYTLRNTTDNQTKSIHSYTLEILGTEESLYSNGENVINTENPNIFFIRTAILTLMDPSRICLQWTAAWKCLRPR